MRGIKVKNLLFPFQVYTLEGMPQKPGKLTMNFDYGASLPITAIEDPTKQAGCLSKFSLPPFGYQAIVPYDKWLNPSPVVTKFVPGHDRRLLTNASRINVPIKFHFSDVMVCEEVLRSLTVRSDTEDGFQASIDPSSIDCKNVAVADSDVSSLTGKPLGEIPSTFSFAANLVDVSNGIHSIIVGNLTTREGKTSTNVRYQLLLLFSLCAYQI